MQTNIVVFSVTGGGITARELVGRWKEGGVLSLAIDESQVRAVTHYDVDRKTYAVDAGTYDDPAHYPEGVLGVWVRGQAVWRDGKATGERPGGVTREPLRRT